MMKPAILRSVGRSLVRGAVFNTAVALSLSLLLASWSAGGEPAATAAPTLANSAGATTELAAQAAQTVSNQTAAESKSSNSKSKRQAAFESLQRFDCRNAILRIVPQIIADAKKPLKDKKNALALAQDLEFISKALYLDENEIAAAQMQEMVVALCPEQERFKAILGDYLARAGRPDEAAKILEGVKPDEKTDGTMLKMVIQNKTRNFDPRSAKELAERFKDRADLKDDPWFQAIRARAWVKSGLNKTAAKLLRLAARIEKSEYSKNLWLAAVSSFEGHPEESKRSLALAAKALPNDPLWRVDVAAIDAGQDADDSFDMLLEALRCDRFCSRGFTAYAKRMVNEHRFNRAQSCLDYLGRVKPASAEMHFERARLLKVQGKLKEAIEEFERGIKLQPHTAPAYIDAATIYSDLKDPNGAEKVLIEGTKQTPNTPRIWLALGNHDMKEGKFDESAAAYKKALSLAPQPLVDANVLVKNEFGIAHARLASLAYVRGNRAVALNEALTFNQLKIILDVPGLSAVHLRPGRLSAEAPKLAAARDEWESTILADALFECKDFDNAAKEYRKALAVHADDSDLHSYLLNVLADKGDWSAAASEDLNLSNSIIKDLPKKIGGLFHK
jgi:tetratricopeptide (TPR) repeat protein